MLASILLRLVFIVSGAILVVRAIAGPFHFLVAVRSPLTSETVLAVTLLACLALRHGRPAAASSEKAPRLAVVAVLAIVALCFLPALPQYFVDDDFLVLAYSRRFKPADVSFVLTASTSGGAFFRPVGILIWVLETLAAGARPLVWHAVGLALHLVNCALVYVFAKTLLSSGRTALWATAFFGLHPASPEAVCWPGGGQDTLLSTMFLLASAILFLVYADRRTKPMLVASLAAGLFALFSKESSYVLPALVVILAWRVKAPLRLTLPYWLLTAAAFAYRTYVLHGFGGYPGMGLSAIGALKALGLRIWAVLAFPVNWSTGLEGYLLAGIAAGVVGYGVLAFFAAAPRCAWLAAALTLLFAAPSVQMLLIGADLLNARLLYLAAVGFALVLACAVEAMPWQAMRVAAGLAILLFYVASLEHGLSIRGRVAEISRRTCMDGARGTVVTAAPRVVDGVWLFASGLPECIQLQKDLQSSQPTQRRGS